ncbi:Nicotinamide-nucleotide adenylyltransferase [Sergentomyia squamirostris]
MLPKVILIACGSFSPPTPMHFRMFEIARDYFQQMGTHEVIGGIVSPVHDSYGKKGLVASKHRIAMLRMALKTSEWIRISDWESSQDGWTRTRVTLQYHQNYINSMLNDVNNVETIPGWLPGNLKQMTTTGSVQVKLICGADLLESFSVPGLWENDDIEAILGHHGIVVISRSGSNPEQFIFNSDVLSKHRRNIHIVTNWVPNEVSSSMIRRLLSRGQSVKYLLDESIIDYIMKNSLFGANSHKYILTPNHNEVIAYPAGGDENGIILNLHKIDNNRRQYEDMDETDYTMQKSPASSTNGSGSLDLVRPKMFCCGDSLNMKTLRNRPGQAVQIRTDASGSHTTSSSLDTDEVGEDEDDDSTCTLTALPAAIDRSDGVSQTSSDDIEETLSSRSYTDMIKFVFTEHGIRVISDKEYVV